MIRVAAAACLALSLSGCAGLVLGLQAAAGVATIAKDVLDIDVSIHQATPGKTPVASVLAPQQASSEQAAVPRPAPTQMNEFYEER